jgi:hypothetical protein
MSSEPYSTARALWRTAGVIVLCFALLAVTSALLAPRNGLFGVRFSSSHEVARFTANLVGIVIVGVGLLLLRGWAAVILSLAGIYGAFLCIRQAVNGINHPVPGQWDWVGFIFALLSLVPAVLTACSWKTLVWWKKA